MFKEDISRCCMECERLAGELAALRTQAEGLLRRWLNEAECLEARQFEMQEGCPCVNCENYRETVFFLSNPTNPTDDPSVCLAYAGAPTEHICPSPAGPDTVLMGHAVLEGLQKGEIKVTSNAKSNFEARSYLDKPYYRCFVPNPFGGYTGHIREFPGCLTEGATLDETYSRLDGGAEDWIGAILALGQKIPKPLEKP